MKKSPEKRGVHSGPKDASSAYLFFIRVRVRVRAGVRARVRGRESIVCSTEWQVAGKVTTAPYGAHEHTFEGTLCKSNKSKNELTQSAVQVTRTLSLLHLSLMAV